MTTKTMNPKAGKLRGMAMMLFAASLALPSLTYADPPAWAHSRYRDRYDHHHHDRRDDDRHRFVERHRWERPRPIYVQTYMAAPAYYAPPPRYAPVYTAPPARSCGGNVVGAMVGGATGGFLGSQIGRGDGNLAATAAGAVLGVMVGQHLGNPGC